MNKKTLALVLVASIFSAALSEIFVRALRPGDLKTPNQLRAVSLEYEPAVFSRQRIKRESRDIHKSADIRIHINSFGYRGPEIEIPKKRLRIVIYGGSSVFDPLVHESWPEKTQKHLKDLGADVEIINAGIPGNSTAEIVARAASEMLYLKPDVVLLYEAWNDVKFFNPSARRLDELKILEPEKNLFIYHTGPVDAYLSERSYLYLMLRSGFLRQIHLREQKNIPYLSREERYGNEKNYSGEINNFGAQVYLNNRLFIETARAADSKPVLVAQVLLPKEGMREEQRKKIDFSYVELNLQGILGALKEIRQNQRRAANETKTMLVDANQIFSEQEDILFDHVHFTEKGSEAMAKQMALELRGVLQSAATKKR